MKTLNPVRFTLLAAAALFTHTTFAAKPGPTPPPPPPSSGEVVLDYEYLTLARTPGRIGLLGPRMAISTWRVSPSPPRARTR